jgi:hypothetical protein
MTHKSDDFKITTVQHYLDTDNTQTDTCYIFKCYPRSLMRLVEGYSKGYSE